MPSPSIGDHARAASESYSSSLSSRQSQKAGKSHKTRSANNSRSNNNDLAAPDSTVDNDHSEEATTRALQGLSLTANQTSSTPSPAPRPPAGPTANGRGHHAGRHGPTVSAYINPNGYGPRNGTQYNKKPNYGRGNHWHAGNPSKTYKNRSNGFNAAKANSLNPAAVPFFRPTGFHHAGPVPPLPPTHQLGDTQQVAWMPPPAGAPDQQDIAQYPPGGFHPAYPLPQPPQQPDVGHPSYDPTRLQATHTAKWSFANDNWYAMAEAANVSRAPSTETIWRPAPSPTELYQMLAYSHPTVAPQKQHLLIVLDVNGTLLHRRRRSTAVTKRPGLDAFFAYILANHSVMIWTSARPETLEALCPKFLAPPDRARLAGCWARNTLDLTPWEYTQKVQVYKDLNRVWSDLGIQAVHPRAQDGMFWHQGNTILVDDSYMKAAAQPHNLIEIPEMNEKTLSIEAELNVLTQVQAYIEEARQYNDVSAWMQKNPFEIDHPSKRQANAGRGKKGKRGKKKPDASDAHAAAADVVVPANTRDSPMSDGGIAVVPSDDAKPAAGAAVIVNGSKTSACPAKPDSNDSSTTTTTSTQPRPVSPKP